MRGNAPVQFLMSFDREQQGRRTLGRAGGGSSPRLRGTGAAQLVRLIRGRFIPAPAGNSCGAVGDIGHAAVHPRACGEQTMMQPTCVDGSGSSPRLRGTAAERDDLAHRDRFIPAPAGNSASAPPSSAAPPVHPRACGEQEPAPGHLHRRGGSSPRLRGTEGIDVPAADARRFIPAPAGNSSFRGTLAGGHTVHPRACGEQPRRSGRFQSPPGSSPRLRGTGSPRWAFSSWPGFIPAPAGNSD